MQNTLVVVTFDENHSYAKQNRIVGILLGDAIPKALVGTTDDTYYNHYSELSTVHTGANYGGRTVLAAVVQTWGKLLSQSAYTSAVEIPDGMHPEAEFK